MRTDLLRIQREIREGRYLDDAKLDATASALQPVIHSTAPPGPPEFHGLGGAPFQTFVACFDRVSCEDYEVCARGLVEGRRASTIGRVGEHSADRFDTSGMAQAARDINVIVRRDQLGLCVTCGGPLAGDGLCDACLTREDDQT